MTQNQWIDLVLALLFAIIASLCANAEAALDHLSHSRAVELAEDGRASHRRLIDMTSDPAPYVNASTLLRTCAEIASVLLVAVVIFGQFDAVWQQVLVSGAIMVVVSFLMWGVTPRTLGKQHDVKVCMFWSRLWAGMATVLAPVAQVLILVGNAVTPGKGFADGPFTTESELREMVDYAESSDLIEADERDMIHSVFDLGDTLLKEVMVPRTDVVFIKADRNLRQALSLALRSGFSRIPVIGAGLDDVQGVLYLKDIIKRLQDKPDADRSETVSSIMRPAVFSPDSRPVDGVLKDMQMARNHITVVVDEFGGTAGLATIEDILEEIVGEIVDEYDPEPTQTEQLEDGVFRVPARMQVDDLGKLFDLDVDDDDVETVGGLVAKELSVVPIAGSSIVWEGLQITADKTTGRRHQVATYVVRRAPEDSMEQENDDDR